MCFISFHPSAPIVIGLSLCQHYRVIPIFVSMNMLHWMMRGEKSPLKTIMKKITSSFEELEKELMKNPKFVEEYERMRPYYDFYVNVINHLSCEHVYRTNNDTTCGNIPKCIKCGSILFETPSQQTFT